MTESNEEASGRQSLCQLSHDANDTFGDREYQTEHPRCRLHRRVLVPGGRHQHRAVEARLLTRLDILQLFRVITFSTDQLSKEGTPADEELAYELEFQGFDHNDALEGQMAGYIDFLTRGGCWTELKSQLERIAEARTHPSNLGNSED